MWKVPFSDLVNSKKFEDNLKFIYSLEPKVEDGDLTELSENVVNKEAFRVFPIKQKDLLRDGTKSGKYSGNKWGGKFLRAPDIFFTILRKGKGKLVRLGDIAEVKRGFTTGANEFFYVEDVTEKIGDDELEKVENLRGFTSVEEVKRAGLKVIKPSKWGKNAKDYKLFLVEEEFLKPVIKSPRELKTIVVKEEDLKYKVFMCNRSRKELSKTFALDYIRWGEEQEFHKRPTCRSRKEWWSLPEKCAFIVSKRFIDEDFSFFVNPSNFFVGDTFFIIESNKGKNWSIALFLNSSICFLFLECFGRKNMGEGVLLIYGTEIKPVPVLPEIKAQHLRGILKEKIKYPIFTEFGFDPNKPIREQEPNPLPDRKALDDIVFDALGLTEEERKEVYYAVAELVQNLSLIHI
jgi:hypothetical protein